MQPIRLPFFAIAILSFAAAASAGFRGPGDYHGIVVFDRWGACTLQNGIYLMYVSERTKEGLRAHAGKAVKLDAEAVFVIASPGDGRIGAFRDLGLMPPFDPGQPTKRGRPSDGLSLDATFQTNEAGRALLTLTIRNDGSKPQAVRRGDLAPTLLTKKEGQPAMFALSDGPSGVLVTRSPFWPPFDDDPWPRKRLYYGDERYGYTVDRSFPETFTIEPGGERRFGVEFILKPGEYDFLFGYGENWINGPPLASNLVAFDVDDAGRATAVEVERRDPQEVDAASGPSDGVPLDGD